ncbi:FMN-linked oxidoreductase [Polyplosphaeria fusca]|uniref:FMN-linked oxidoreductase n=1 Tax=Polyplosphaeria fusca TaxID=682080 RepID=A0A9P4QS71_9PLEO|nr:FMN-linked oxidoreductase [Polyplosphaeria fusca]
MGTYSSHDGYLSRWQHTHYASLICRGPALSFIEVAAVTPQGRTSPLDLGIYDDAHVEGLKAVVGFARSEGQKVGVQLGHSGWKGSMMPILPGRAMEVLRDGKGGWEGGVMGPGTERFKEEYVRPREMTGKDIEEMIGAFGSAAKRAVDAGFDAIEIHGAHGYMFTSFMSPRTNRRTDAYGGSFENRVRILVEVIQSVRDNIPDTMPLFVRISATEWMEWDEQPSWDIEDSIKLARILPRLGVDVLDVSSGGNSPTQKIPIQDAYYQINLAEKIRAVLQKEEINLLICAVGSIDNAEMARDVVENVDGHAKADMLKVGRQFLRDPSFVLTAAKQLGVTVQWPYQFWRAAPGR